MSAFEERFWSKVDIQGPDECWEWRAARLPKGYGRISAPRTPGVRRVDLAHRVSWELASGLEVPKGVVIMHKCDNPPCVNPAHLRAGTYAENTADMDAKGRRPVGERSAVAKLKSVEVDAIRARYAAGEASQAALGDEYGVSQTLVSQVVRRKIWNS